MSNGRCAEFLIQSHIATLGAKRGLHGTGHDINALLQSTTGFFFSRWFYDHTVANRTNLCHGFYFLSCHKEVFIDERATCFQTLWLWFSAMPINRFISYFDLLIEILIVDHA